jgi:hypothetical protein
MRHPQLEAFKPILGRIGVHAHPNVAGQGLASGQNAPQQQDADSAPEVRNLGIYAHTDLIMALYAQYNGFSASRASFVPL